ncbi:MAG: class I tRNA ligase family protein, partial [Nitrososphaerales archaeon]|nr:class I tRNA ligase family protein [Nitrososphaerales archaeon]
DVYKRQEGIDQTRGWAYTLLINNVIMTGKAEAPFKAFLFQGHVLDEKGDKMSKSLGNIIDGYKILSTQSVDTLRFYLIWKASPIDSLSFSVKEMNARPYQVLNTLYHMHLYFQQNSSYDGYDHTKYDLRWALERGLLKDQERWLLSKLQSLILNVTEGYSRCRFHEAARALEEFIIEVLSQTYVPLTRSEIWDDDPKTLDRRLAIYATLAHTLKTLDVLIHPIAPYTSEYLYNRCFEKKILILARWPEVESEFIDKELESEFEMLKEMISLANAARMEVKIKRRWPLRRAVYLLDKNRVKIMERFSNILREQINVKEVKFTSDIEDLPIKIQIKLNYGTLGPKLKSEMPKFLEGLSKIDGLQIYKALKDLGEYSLRIDDRSYTLSKEDVKVEYLADEGYVVKEKDGIIVALQIVRDRDLVAEGLVRDLARRLQALRKERGYRPTDILDTAYIAGADEELESLVKPRSNELTYLVRVKRVSFVKEASPNIPWSDIEFDERKLKISIV